MRTVNPLPDPVYIPELNCYRVFLRGGKSTLVDPEDLPRVMKFRWSAQSQKGYVMANFSISLHRMVMGEPEGLQVDHINGDRLDNRKQNLRACSPMRNCYNKLKVKHFRGKAPSSRFKGVSKHRNKWMAQIKVGGERTRLGFFKTEIEAARAYDAAVKEHHGEFGKTNRELGLYT